jgi:hypothetical protein
MLMGDVGEWKESWKDMQYGALMVDARQYTCPIVVCSKKEWVGAYVYIVYVY